MANLNPEIRDYFSTTSDSFWHWQDDGESIAWKDQKTIAFADEIKDVLKYMSPFGLPRLGSLLILVAATRDSWAEDSSEVGLLASMLASISKDSKKDENNSNTNLLQRVLVGLHKIRTLEGELRKPLKSKLALIEIVFEGQIPAVPWQKANLIADALRPGLVSLLETSSKVTSSGYGPLSLVQDLAALAPGLEKIHPEVIKLRQKTGLNELPLPAQLESPSEEVSPCDAARNLLEELSELHEYKGIAQVAKQLLPTTSIPRKLTESREQELGGFSDIANRGTPDRLLLSELAQDGLTLAVRVSMNEAMYLHREKPPSSPRVRRELLIDSGVRAWGTPRLFVAAAALAISATVPRESSLGVWRGSGTSLREVDLTTKDGFIEHLAVLEADPNLAKALPDFVRRIGSSSEPVEPILLIPEDAFEDDDFVQAIREVNLDRFYIATVGRNGIFQLSEHSPRGKKQLQQSEVNLDLLFGKEIDLSEAVGRGRLPAISRTNPFPLRLPHILDPEKCWSIGNAGALSITGDGRLMHWKDRKKGGVQLCEQIPKGKLWWAAPTCIQEEARFVFGTEQKKVFYKVNLTSGEVSRTLIQCSVASGITFHNDVLFCCSQKERKIFEINVESGEVVHEQVVPMNLKWKRGRFFTGRHGEWYALSHNGNSATIDQLTENEKPKDPVICVWDAVGFEGPLSLTEKGKILALESEPIRLPKSRIPIADCSVSRISPDGLVIQGACEIAAIGHASHVRIFRIHLGGNQYFDTKIHRLPLDDRVQPYVSTYSLRKNFKSIGVTEAGKLTLVSNKDQLVSFIERQGMPLFTVVDAKQNLLQTQKFSLSETDDVRYRLSTADWPDGSQAILDSRGLLHLKPSNPNVPEISLVLAEGEITAWCSDARAFGKPYFLPDAGEYPSRGLDRRKICDETLAKFVEGIRAAN